MKKQLFLTAFCLGSFALQSLSFCGFYVAKADTKLFNKTSQVIMVRDGNKTTVTMANDFKGNVKDFAMVIPVPNVLQKKDIRIVENSLFNKLDAYSGPRLVEYYDENPCSPRIQYDMLESIQYNNAIPTSISMKDVKRNKVLGVTIEAQYQVDEYDILILSAKESDGLKTWLTENGYKIPTAAAEVLAPYIKNNLKFFVVKVDLDKLNEINGTTNLNKYIKTHDNENIQNLRPIQISYTSPKFMLPIRLGMANSTGAQDMVVYAFSKEGRVECTNYRTVKIPSNENIPLFVKNKFGQFYVDLFERAHDKENKEAIFLEYAWNISPQFRGAKCDPCVGPPPIFTDLTKAGVNWAMNNGNQASSNVFFTRLHLRYSRNTHPRDLEFQVTPNKEHFQARYILTNTAVGDLSCNAGQTYCATVIKNRVNELENLSQLTSWSTVEYSGYVKEYYDLLKDKNILNEVKSTQKNKQPWLGVPSNESRLGLKIALFLSVVFLLTFAYLIRQKNPLASK
ncbi:DUF2330 domain-containing protein [Putridiphycobacter roseus]|nr:DUF2330 domain-containing protein [Putridiphycobacter roseus]